MPRLCCCLITRSKRWLSITGIIAKNRRPSISGLNLPDVTRSMASLELSALFFILERSSRVNARATLLRNGSTFEVLSILNNPSPEILDPFGATLSRSRNSHSTGHPTTRASVRAGSFIDRRERRVAHEVPWKRIPFTAKAPAMSWPWQASTTERLLRPIGTNKADDRSTSVAHRLTAPGSGWCRSDSGADPSSLERDGD